MTHLIARLRLRQSDACLMGCLLALSCSSNPESGSSSNGGTSNGHAGAGQILGGSGSAAVAAGGASAGAGTVLGTGGAAGAAAGASGGLGGASGSSSAVAGANGASPSVTITSHAVNVTGGAVFNVGDDYFDDTFIPPSPLANFGFHTPIVPLVRADGSLDVAWLDYTAGKGKPFELPVLGMVNVTHIDAALSVGTTVATGIKSYKLLGFTTDPSGNFYIAYNADSSFKSTTKNDPNNVNGNELRIAKSSGADWATLAWDSLLFGDVDNTKDLSKGNAGAAGSGVLGYDALNQKLVVYVAHQMAWGDNGTRHQAGFFAYVDPATGKALTPGGPKPVEEFGADWFYSHNFDQRLWIDSGTAYVLAHGDAYSRQLGLSAFTQASFSGGNATTFDQSYFAITGAAGGNNTNAETGQFVRLGDGRFALVHTSSQGRAARDVHVVLTNGLGVTASDAWLTTNAANTQATMPKLGVLNQQLFVSYGLWDSTTGRSKAINWYYQMLDLSLKVTKAATAMPDVEFVAGSPLVRFSAGASSATIGWVSGNASHTLSVNVVSAK